MKQGALAGYKVASFETTYDHVRIYDSTRGKEVIYGGCAKLQHEAVNSREQIKA